jgi:MoxR-like ATPase
LTGVPGDFAADLFSSPSFGADAGAKAIVDTLPAPSLTQDLISRLRQRLNAALRGKARVVEQVLACLLARGHLLLEDLPGLGKTTLAKALAQAVGGTFARVQCTPDLLPGDITGFSIFNQKTREFEFRPGPVFADVLLADEINRATPRAQSALLEAMAERQVTVDNVRHPLSSTAFVIATQNPVEHHGTYPLPEAQLDRFAMKLRIGHPERADELALLAAAVGHLAGPQLETTPVLAAGQLAFLQSEAASVAVAPALQEYLVDLAQQTRLDRRVVLGLSPRGLLTWQRVAQAWALLHGRTYVIPDDIQDTARPVLEVRLGVEAEVFPTVLNDLLAVPVPVS